MTEPSPLLTLPEVAELLRRPVGTLRDWRLKGTGPKSARIHGRIYYRRADVEAWVAAHFTESDNR